MADPSVRIDSYELYLLRKGDGIFRDKILYLEPSGIGCKKFEKSAPRIIFAQLSIFWNQFTLGQTFTSTDRTFCPNHLIWTVLLEQGWLNP